MNKLLEDYGFYFQGEFIEKGSNRSGIVVEFFDPDYVNSDTYTDSLFRIREVNMAH